MQPEDEKQKEDHQRKQRVVGFRDGLARAFHLTQIEVDEAGFDSPAWGDIHGLAAMEPAIMFSNILRRINAENGIVLRVTEERLLIEGARRIFGSIDGKRIYDETLRLSKTVISNRKNNNAYKLWKKMTSDKGNELGMFLGENRELAAMFEILMQKGYWSSEEVWEKIAGRILGARGSAIPYSTLASEASKYREGGFETGFTKVLAQLPDRPAKPKTPKVSPRKPE